MISSQPMNWENLDCFEEKEASNSQNGVSTEDMSVEAEDRKFLPLNKFQDPILNITRQGYIALMNKFGHLITQQSFEEIKNDLLTENCLFFLLNLFDDPKVVYAKGGQDFFEIYKGAIIQERRVRTTHVDVEKKTGCQVTECKVLYQGSTNAVDQFVFEVFTFENSKIMKYRAGFGARTDLHGDEDCFELTRKDIMLAKVKELNYAFAGQPNLERIASLLHDTTEYKIWSWDDQKCFTFHKSDLVNNFHSLEENFIIECIVPYELYSEIREKQYIISTYVYYLEDKTACPGKKYVWLSTSIFSFDQNLDICQICQQGELYPKNEANIPFESFTREKIVEKANDLSAVLKSGADLFYSGKANFNCCILRFGPTKAPVLGYFGGMKQLEKLIKSLHSHCKKIEWAITPDIYVDFNGSSYDALFLFSLAEGSVNAPEYKYSGKIIDFTHFSLCLFENGKLAKIYQFMCEIPDVIISPFDDPAIEGINIKSLKYISEGSLERKKVIF